MKDQKDCPNFTGKVKVNAVDFAAFQSSAYSVAARVSEKIRVIPRCLSAIKQTAENTVDSARPNTAAPKLWIVNPTIDLFFVCGGMLWLLVALSISSPELFASKTAPAHMLLTQIGAIFFLDAHNAATILRICNERELRAKYKFLWLWAPLVLSFLFVLCLLHQPLLLVILRIYLTLVPHHITAQSYGICMMYFARTQTLPTLNETFALKIAFTLMAITSIIRNFSGKAVSELMGVAVPSLVLFPDSLGWCFAGLAWVATLFASGLILNRASHVKGTRMPFGAFTLLFTTLTLMTLGPSLGLAVVFSSAFFHASQYLVVSGLVHLKKADQMDLQPPAKSGHPVFKTATFWGQTIVLGMLLYLAVPTALSHFGIPVLNAAVAVLCFASLHHFLADAVIWRMRDPKSRAALSA